MEARVVRFAAEQQLYQKQRDFVLNLTAFLQRHKQYGAFLALLEAGSALNGATSDLLAALDDYPPQQYSVLLEDCAQLEEVAPYLINLASPAWRGENSALTAFADWLFARQDFARLGVFFVSQAPFAHLKAFWQRFSYASFYNDKQAYFRFYNPRFFHALIKKLGKKDYQTISSVLEMIFYFDYFNPQRLHIYRFYPQGYRQEDCDIMREDSAALIRRLFAEPPPV